MSGLLVTGAAGMLGHDVLRSAEREGIEAHGLSRGELDITDAGAVAAAIAAHAPEAIINCAAWTDVDGAESNEEAAFAINAIGPKVLAESGVRLINVSTDYVFAGDKPSPYVESDPVNPRSAYGRTKLAGDQAVLAANPAHAVVRTAWLFGVDGNNFVETMLRLATDRGAVSVVDDQHGCPTWTGHLADALVSIAQNPESGGIHHCAGAGSTTWHGFAAEIFAKTGTTCDLSATTSDQFVRPAKRPANSVLESTRSDTPRLPDWHDGLDAYIAARAATPGGTT